MKIDIDKVTLQFGLKAPIVIDEPEVVDFFCRLEHIATNERVTVLELFDERIDNFKLYDDDKYVFTFTRFVESDLKIAYKKSTGRWSVLNLYSNEFYDLSLNEAVRMAVVHKLI